MKTFKSYLRDYETILQEREKVEVNEGILHAKTFGIFAILVLVVFGIGSIFNLLQNLGYLVFMATIVVFITFTLSKVLLEIEIQKQQTIQYSVWRVIRIDCLYLIVTLLTTALVLLFTAYGQAAKPLLVTSFLVIFIGSSIVYHVLFKSARKVILPSLLKIIINGIFLAGLFYSISMLIRIHNVPLSFAISIILSYALVELKVYLEKRYVFHISRFVVVFIGPFLILLSFPFNQAFNVMSVYRGEFSLRMVYDKYVNPVAELDEDIDGELLFYEGKLIVVGEEDISFYKTDFTLDQTIDNEYNYVYVMNGHLLANKEDTSNIYYNDVYEWDGSDFVFLGEFYMQSAMDKVFFDEHSYTTIEGYVYQRLDGTDTYEVLPVEDNRDLEFVEETEDYLLFNRQYPYFVHGDSFQDTIRGVNYRHIGYDNGHIIIIYERLFVVQKPAFVDPRDDKDIMLYLTNTDDYFSGNVYVPPVIEMPDLFIIDQYHYEENRHFLLGHVLYSTGERTYSMLILDDEATLINEIILENLDVAISEDHIALHQDGAIKIFPIDAETGLNYRIINGYGITFLVSALVTLFAIDQMRLNPHIRGEEEEKKALK